MALETEEEAPGVVEGLEGTEEVEGTEEEV